MPRRKTPVHQPEVDAWFAASDSPLADVMRLVRDAVLLADPRVTECIKWTSPTFVYAGNIASISPRARHVVQLMFHRGAEIPGTFPHLTGSGEVARYVNFATADEVNELRSELQSAVRAWCDLKDDRES